LEAQFTLSSHHPGADRTIAHRADLGGDAEPPCEIAGDLAQRLAVLQAPRSLDMQREIAIAEAKPRLAAEARQGRHESPGLRVASPAQLGVGEPAERIQN